MCDLLPFLSGKLSQADLINSFWLFLVSLFSSTYLKRHCARIFQELSYCDRSVPHNRKIVEVERNPSRFSPIPWLPSFSLYNIMDDIQFLSPTVSLILSKFSVTLRWFHPLWVLLGEVHAQVICKYLILPWAVSCSFPTPVSYSCPFVTDINISCHITHKVFIHVQKHLAVWTQHFLLLAFLLYGEVDQRFPRSSPPNVIIKWSSLLTLKHMVPCGQWGWTWSLNSSSIYLKRPLCHFLWGGQLRSL